MWLRFKMSCPCQCSYSIGENTKADKIICPNCGLEHPHSEKLLAILKIASDIPDYTSENDVITDLISFNG